MISLVRMWGSIYQVYTCLYISVNTRYPPISYQPKFNLESNTKTRLVWKFQKHPIPGFTWYASFKSTQYQDWVGMKVSKSPNTRSWLVCSEVNTRPTLVLSQSGLPSLCYGHSYTLGSLNIENQPQTFLHLVCTHKFNFFKYYFHLATFSNIIVPRQVWHLLDYLWIFCVWRFLINTP